MKMDEKYNGDTLAFICANERFGAFAIVIEDGTGDNLLDEDIEEGYIDYINWTSYSVKMDDNLPLFVEDDGGMVLTETYTVDMTIKEILDRIFDEAPYRADDSSYLLCSASALSIAMV